MKTGATETTKTTGRDDYACTGQHYRLIRIHDPGRTTGRRIVRRSKKAVVQKEEHPAGQECLMPGIAVGNGEPAPAKQKEADRIRPGPVAGSREIRPKVPEESGKIIPEIPAESGDLEPEILERSADLKPVIPAGSDHVIPEIQVKSKDLEPGITERSADRKPEIPEGSGDLKKVIPAQFGNPGPGTPEGCTDPGPGLAAGSVDSMLQGSLLWEPVFRKPGLQEPAGNKESRAGSPAPENTGGGTR